ncbi:hypothetical protein BU14_0091s0026 [Porphyra umbilicalis]|uniref:Transmembrane protein n=1 Tax=Porphyra umbilicalis TaxID=2786 RepID=A0A1X6PE68_PORUM|nr:hypothetical protein BU14_0091s0026 [Porphyra umbilicalis]|eukprot:OSX79046.1 hypothetical protein BU14_0091s0026 [Porphyra umbilicalis]
MKLLWRGKGVRLFHVPVADTVGDTDACGGGRGCRCLLDRGDVSVLTSFALAPLWVTSFLCLAPRFLSGFCSFVPLPSFVVISVCSCVFPASLSPPRGSARRG